METGERRKQYVPETFDSKIEEPQHKDNHANIKDGFGKSKGNNKTKVNLEMIF